MADSKIQIEVEVIGADKANKQIQSLETSSVDLKDGVKGVGENFKSVGDLVKAQGGVMGDAFGTLGDSVIAITDSVFVFKEGMATAGATGAKAWIGLLGPISAVVGAIALAVDAYKQLSGATREAEMWEEAMSATASDLTSRMEALAESGLKPTINELKTFIALNQQARFSLELLGLKNETLTKLYKAQKDATDQVNKAKQKLDLIEERNNKSVKVTNLSLMEQIKLLPTLVKDLYTLDDATDTITDSKKDLEDATKKVQEAEKELARIYEKEVIPQLQNALRAQEIASKSQLQLEDDLYNKLKEVESAEVNRLTLENKKTEALKQVGTALEKHNLLTTLRKNKEKALEDQLKRNIITQDQYESGLRKLKEEIYDETKALDDSIEAKKRDVRASQDASEKRAISDELSSKAMEKRQRIYDREIELINREKQEILDLATERSQIFDLELKNQLKDMAVYKVRKFNLLQEVEIQDDIMRKYKLHNTASKLLVQDYDDLSTASKKYLDLITIMSKGDPNAISKQAMPLFGSTIQHIELSKMIVEKTQENIVNTLVESDLKILDKQKEYQLKNRKQLNLSQKQIEEDYIYHKNRILDLANKEARDRFLIALENQIRIRETRTKDTLDYAVMIQNSGLSQIEAEKKINQMRYENQDKSERSRLDLMNKVNELEIKYLEEKSDSESYQINKRLELLENNKDMEKSLYTEMYTVLGELSVEGREKLFDIENAYIEQKKELEEKSILNEKNNIILREEIALKQKNIVLENYLYEKKYGKDRLSLLETLFLTEDQMRERAIEDTDEYSQKNLKRRIEENRSIKKNYDEIMTTQIEYEKGITESYKRIADSTMVELAKELSVQPKDQKEETQKELRIKQLKDEYNLELEIYRLKEQEKANLQGEYNKTKEKLLKEENELTAKYKSKQIEDEFKTFNTVGQMLKDFGDSSTQALISSGVAAAFAGENIANSLKITLRGLAQEATAKSLLEGAYALGALAMGDTKGAGLHGLASLKFAMAGIAVGAMSSIGGSVSSGAGGSSTTTTTPTGNTQGSFANRPSEDKGQTQNFYINFGGAVIYDTKASAERAMANRIMSLGSQSSRGQSRSIQFRDR